MHYSATLLHLHNMFHIIIHNGAVWIQYSKKRWA